MKHFKYFHHNLQNIKHISNMQTLLCTKIRFHSLYLFFFLLLCTDFDTFDSAFVFDFLIYYFQLLTLQHKLFYIHRFVIVNPLHKLYNSYGTHIVNMCVNILHKYQLPYNNHRHRYLHIYYFVIARVKGMLNNLLQLVHCKFHKLNGMRDSVRYHNIQLKGEKKITK